MTAHAEPQVAPKNPSAQVVQAEADVHVKQFAGQSVHSVIAPAVSVVNLSFRQAVHVPIGEHVLQLTSVQAVQVLAALSCRKPSKQEVHWTALLQVLQPVAHAVQAFVLK